MKTRLFLCFLLGLIANVSILANTEATAKEIALRGMLDSTGSRSVVLPAIVAQQLDDVISVTFTKQMGVVNISITSQEGEIVYSSNINAVALTQTIIYIGDYAPGMYLLEFTNATGRIYGEFIVEEE